MEAYLGKVKRQAWWLFHIDPVDHFREGPGCRGASRPDGVTEAKNYKALQSHLL